MLHFKNNINEIGIDEAGRGPLLGPVYAGAVIWEEGLEFELIKDSKKLTKLRRKKAFDWIMDNVKYWGVGSASEKEIDDINILQATKLAMDRAVDDLHTKTKDSNLIIENMIIDGVYWEKHNFPYPVESIVKGDNKFYSIACASIIAKEFHDKHIMEIVNTNPDIDKRYNLAKNMGYGTVAHLDGIKKFGICEYHRKSFKCYN